MSKKYGLIDRASDAGPIKKHAAFASDSDSDEGGTSKVKIELGANQKRQAQAVQQKAIEEDPTIYQYDELYDDMVEQREKTATQGKEQAVDRKPKYIGKLMETAERRKKEHERRIERQVQKERDAEGEKFKDKESFVTSAYRAKLEEMKKLEEQEKREEYLESIGDVTKQSDLDGFYRHIYQQKTKDEKKNDVVKEEALDEKPEEPEDKPEKVEKLDRPKTSSQRERKYRKRKSDDENEEHAESNEPTERTHLQSNLDADSDFSIDSDSSSDSSDGEEEKDQTKNETLEEKKETNGHSKAVTEPTEGDQESSKEEGTVTEEPVAKKPKPPPIDIWKKRTVGDVFEAAQQRYFERRQMQASC
uniref:DUF2040 domain-containing protein n=1 Tax=Anopheles christyi TaxID=43041 RepID=A0A182JX00_9DIPT